VREYLPIFVRTVSAAPAAAGWMKGGRCLLRPWGFRYGRMKEASPGLVQGRYGFSNEGEET
jgi:hypothetical protein